MIGVLNPGPMRKTSLLLAPLVLGVVVTSALPPPAAASGIAGYGPLHTLLETIAVVVASLVFATGWHAYSRELPGNAVMLACAFLGVGLLDFSHALSFAGMPDYVTPSGPEKAIDFWLVARTLAGLALLLAAVAPWRPLARGGARYAMLVGVLALTALTHWLLLFHPEVVPRTFEPGTGLTPFKIGWEYALIALNLAAAAALWIRMRTPQTFNAPALFAAVSTMAMSEFFFTLYASVTDVYNLMGHLYKVVAYLFLYRAIFVEAVESPYRQLRSAQTRLQATISTIPDLLWLKDVDGVYLDCNPAMERLFGRARADIIGKTDLDLVPPALATTFRDHDRLAMTQHATSAQERWLTFAGDGYHGLFETVKAPMRDASGRLVGVVGIARDVTAARQGQEALRLSEQRLVQAAQVAHIGIFDHDHLNGTLYWSEEQRRIYGFEPDEPVDPGQALACVLPEDLDAFRAAMDRAGDPAGGGLADVECRICRRDHQIRHLVMRSITIFDGKGRRRRKLRTVGAVLDITERKHAEATQRSLEAQLRESQKMESIGTLAGGIAHDFNNILGAILGNAALARGDLPRDHPAVASLEQIAKAGTRARDLVQQILAFSRRQPQERVRQPLRPLIEDTLSLLRSTLPAKVSVATTLTETALQINADSTQIQQVLMNLCTNAWHALADSTGGITIGLQEVWLDETAAHALRTPTAGWHAHLWVSDTGIGMDAATRERIFEPFFTTKPAGQGTGLGLSVVHGIVTSHDGAIRVDSAVGHGTTIHLYFPAERVSASAAHPLVVQAALIQGHGEHVLYIDDDEVMLLMVERLLQRLGYRTTCCANAREALELLRRAPQDVDAVVSDYNMPGVSGVELAEAVRRLRSELPIIISSGYISEELRSGAQRTGVRHLVQKQHTLDELPPLLRRILAR